MIWGWHRGSDSGGRSGSSSSYGFGGRRVAACLKACDHPVGVCGRTILAGLGLDVHAAEDQLEADDRAQLPGRVDSPKMRAWTGSLTQREVRAWSAPTCPGAWVPVAGKGVILDELCATTGWHRYHARKALTRRLNRGSWPRGRRVRDLPPGRGGRVGLPLGRVGAPTGKRLAQWDAPGGTALHTCCTLWQRSGNPGGSPQLGSAHELWVMLNAGCGSTVRPGGGRAAHSGPDQRASSGGHRSIGCSAVRARGHVAGRRRV